MAAAAATFEQIDEFLKGADLASFQPGGKFHLTAEQARANPSLALKNLCPAYRLMRPILNAMAAIPLIPANWKGVIKAFTGVMDELCPNAGK